MNFKKGDKVFPKDLGPECVGEIIYVNTTLMVDVFLVWFDKHNAFSTFYSHQLAHHKHYLIKTRVG